MKKLFLIAFFAIFSVSAYSQQYMMVTTVESVIGGGLGRSKMLIAGPDGKTQEIEMENLFSMGGIKFENITKNNELITKKINELTAQGWSLESTTPGIFSSGSGSGIFMTRYLFAKEE